MLNEWDRWNVRGQLLIVPNDQLELRVIADTEEFDEACCGVANLLDGPTGAAIRGIGGNLVPNDGFAYENFYDFNPENEIESSGISLQVDYDWDTVTLTSITAFRTLDRFENADIDFTSAPILEENTNDTEIDTFTQELRLTSSGDGNLDWLAGFFYFDEEVQIDSTLAWDVGFRPYADFLTTAASGGIPFVDPSPLAGIEAALMIPPGTFFGPGLVNDESAGQDDQTISVFRSDRLALFRSRHAHLGRELHRGRKRSLRRRLIHGSVLRGGPGAARLCASLRRHHHAAADTRQHCRQSRGSRGRANDRRNTLRSHESAGNLQPNLGAAAVPVSAAIRCVPQRGRAGNV